MDVPNRISTLSRRDVLKGIAGGGLVLGSGKALDNVVLGYGVLVGTNLTDQPLHPIADEWFQVFPTTLTLGNYEIRTTEETITLTTTNADYRRTFTINDEPVTKAQTLDDSLGLNGVLAELVTDVTAIQTGKHTFEFYDLTSFFDRLDTTTPRPFTTGVVRGWPSATPQLVQKFTDTSPEDPEQTIHGLTAGFREHTYYDIPRYVAGSIQDNVIFGATDLRAPFQSPTDYESLLGPNRTGLFCYEFTHRSIEALHAVPPQNQRYPIVSARVWDQRHKHVYTAVASVVQDDGELRIPMTFVDYTHTTLYDDLNLRTVLGEGLEAYNTRHRASVIHWHP